MRTICSLLFYELLNVIKVTNQILGKSISGRVKGMKLVLLVTFAWLATMFHHVRERGYKINLLDITA